MNPYLKHTNHTKGIIHELLVKYLHNTKVFENLQKYHVTTMVCGHTRVVDGIQQYHVNSITLEFDNHDKKK